MKRVHKILSRLPKLVFYDWLESPVGTLLILASEKGLACILWEHESKSEHVTAVLKQFQQSATHAIVKKTKLQLQEYFKGERKTFDIPLHLDGTPFQLQAWAQLTQIPYGETISYGEQAAKIGDKNKARAVGMANGLNPISIIIPCHRVIGSNGQLTGFGGGLGNKEFLLGLEISNPNLTSQFNPVKANRL